jgi:predicted DNA-binding transcriptional regulator AlpA
MLREIWNRDSRCDTDQEKADSLRFTSVAEILINLWNIEPGESMSPKPQNVNSRTEVSELLTAKDLEALLKIDQKTIYRYVACGLIPYVRIQSNIRFIKWQIAKWIDARTFLPKSSNKS